MALYAIGDLHLSLSVNKPMDVFGPGWANHTQRLRDAFSTLHDDDVTVLCGDTSWGIDFAQSLEDFRFIDALPGKKLILKGNHDYWWTTLKAFDHFCAEHGFSDFHVLNNSCFFYGELALCGTRGWFYDEQKAGSHDEKIFRRELGRLERSLQLAGEKEKYCFLHYPPRYRGYVCPEILALFETYGVTRCYYGHLHADSIRLALEGPYRGTEYRLVSADHVDFQPQRIG